MKKATLLTVIPLMGIGMSIHLNSFAKGNSGHRAPFVDHEFRQFHQIGGYSFGAIQFPKGAWMADGYKELFTKSQLQKSGRPALRAGGAYSGHFSVERRMGAVVLFGQNLPLPVRLQFIPGIISVILSILLWLAFKADQRKVEQDAAPQIRPRWWVGGLTGGGNVIEVVKAR